MTSARRHGTSDRRGSPSLHPDTVPKADIAELLERLRGHKEVREATIFGQAIHALVDESWSADDLNAPNVKVHPSTPTLEDVFVTLTRAQSR